MKFKQQYRNNYEITYNEKDKPVRYYPYLRNYIFKCFSTKQEKLLYAVFLCYTSLISIRLFFLVVQIFKYINFIPSIGYVGFNYSI